MTSGGAGGAGDRRAAADAAPRRGSFPPGLIPGVRRSRMRKKSGIAGKQGGGASGLAVCEYLVPAGDAPIAGVRHPGRAASRFARGYPVRYIRFHPYIRCMPPASARGSFHDHGSERTISGPGDP